MPKTFEFFLHLISVNVLEMELLVKNLKLRTSFVCDIISNKFLKIFSGAIVKHVSNILYKFFSRGVFLNLMKVSEKNPIFQLRQETRSNMPQTHFVVSRNEKPEKLQKFFLHGLNLFWSVVSFLIKIKLVYHAIAVQSMKS